MAMEIQEFSSFSWKTHIFEAAEGEIKGERMVGRKNGGANGWANFRIHGGAMGGGASDTCEPICSEKNGIFEFRNLIEI